MNNVWAQWGPTIIAVITAIFVAGRTVGRIGDQGKTLLRHNEWLIQHDGKIGSLEHQAVQSKAWREGFAAGKDQRDGH